MIYSISSNIDMGFKSIIIIILLFVIYYLINNNNDNIIFHTSPNIKYNSINSDIENKISNKPNITLYYADWCPHCLNIKPYWDKFYNKNKNIYNILSVNCSNNCPNPNIIGYPTILFEYNKNISEIPIDINSYIDIENYIKNIYV